MAFPSGVLFTDFPECRREEANQVRGRDAVLAEFTAGEVPGRPVKPDRAAGGEQGVKALSQQCAENAAEHVARAAFRHGGIARGVDADLTAAADQGPVAFQNQDGFRVPGRKRKRPGKAPAGEIPAQTAELAFVRGKDQGRAAGREQLRPPPADSEGVGVQDHGAFCILQHGRDDAGGAFAEANPGADDAGVSPVEKREQRSGSFSGKHAVRGRRQRRDHGPVAAGRGDGINAFGDGKLRKPGAAALTGVRRQDRRTGKTRGTRDDQGTAEGILVAALFPPREGKVACLRDGEGNRPVLRRRKVGKQAGILFR